MSLGSPAARLKALQQSVRRDPASAEPALPALTGVEAVVRHWLSSGHVAPCLAGNELLAPSPARYAPLPDWLPEPLGRALRQRGVTQLYSHQAESIAASYGKGNGNGKGKGCDGQHVVIATPTASGKSLCFHLPVLSAIANEPSASAIYLYPTKALSRDQEHDVQALVREAGLDIPAMVFDGDTPGDARRAVRERGRLILTNPDMLHAGILPNHTRWASVFSNLKYVVLDELHTYRGVFGSHMAHVVARLKRIAHFHGSDPRFICATATIGNPREHAARLLGVEPDEVALIDRSGAPSCTRQLFVYNPPIVNEELGIRASALKRAVDLAADLVQGRVPSIVFGQSRNSVEVMLKYLRARCPERAEAIMAYRGGYLPETRRGIERGLRSGEILCVVATNALELGIDVGDLDAVVCVGYPGSIAGTWQRFGRAGRRGDKSIAVLVCGSDSLDQYLANQPDYLTSQAAEQARIDPKNLEIVVQHLKCATFELPFEINSPGDNRGTPRQKSPAPAAGESYAGLDVSATRETLEYLREHGLVHASGEHYHWASDAYPATNVSLRSIGWDNFVIIDVETDRSIAELDWRATHTMLHEQAIYQHDADQYQVERLDYENHKAFVRRVKPDYFTTALTYRSVEVIEQFQDARQGHGRIGFGEVKVIERVTGYKKIKFFTHENAGYGDVHLPEMQMHTTSYWLTLPEAVIAELGQPRSLIIDALRSAGAALETVATISLMCEPRDINRTLGDGAADPGDVPAGRVPHRVAASEGSAGQAHVGGFDPTLFLFDAQPGGVGLAEQIYDQSETLLSRAAGLIRGCSCAAGCPACIGPDAIGASGTGTSGTGTHGGGPASMRKQLALSILARFS